MDFRVGDRVRTPTATGVITAVEEGVFEVTIPGEEVAWFYEHYELELISGNSEEATHNRAKSFTETVSDFSSAVSHENIESISRLGDALGISSFEQNVRRITGQIADLLIAKNKQYSNSALDPIRVFSKANRTEQLKVRADDKLSRIRNGDTSEDAVLDLCGYMILMKIAGESA